MVHMDISPHQRVAITTRVPADLAAQLRELAQRESRTVAGEVRYALSKHVVYSSKSWKATRQRDKT
jgi:hypothetical protein